MMETDRLLLRNYSGTDTEIQDMLKNWVADPAVQAEYGEPVHETYAAVRELLDRYMAEIINRYYDEANKDFIRLRLEAGELVSSGDDDISLYPDVFDKYNI